jgi:L-threonylcarbamoyladenylate synthase
VIAYPTEAVYGLGCDPLNPEAVERLLALKQRPPEKGLILIAAGIEQLLPFVHQLPAALMQPVFDSWPGPATWLLPARPSTPHWLTGDHESLAVRVTDHPIASALCRVCRSPLVSTSANRSGHPAARRALDVRRAFPKGIDAILNGPLGALERPTAIRDALSGRLIRG